jgi:glutamine synthetase
MTTAKDVLKMIKDKDVKFVDLRFTDPRGKMQHVTFDKSLVDEDLFAEGLMFDGSSIAGWKAINESDMKLMPDPAPPHRPVLRADDAGDLLRRARAAPASPTARSAHDRQEGRGLSEADRHRRHAIFGPEAEFFVFDDVRFSADPYNTGFSSTRRRAADQHRHRIRDGQPRPPHAHQGRLLPGAADRQRCRTCAPRCCRSWPRWASRREAPPRGGARPARTRHQVRPADHPGRPHADLQVRHPQRRQAYGKTATFMPKPIYGDNGSGMHVHQSIWKDGKPLFAGNKYADLSDSASTTSAASSSTPRRSTPSPTRRPTPTSGWCRATRRRCCSPTRRATARPRAASRSDDNPKAKRVEVRFPDPGANPYLAFAAMLMAGLDGIKNKIHPGDAMDKNLYDLPPRELKKIPTVCGSLREALDEPRQGPRLPQGRRRVRRRHDRRLHRAEDGGTCASSMTPHPVEFDMYYSV